MRVQSSLTEDDSAFLQPFELQPLRALLSELQKPPSPRLMSTRLTSSMFLARWRCPMAACDQSCVLTMRLVRLSLPSCGLTWFERQRRDAHRGHRSQTKVGGPSRCACVLTTASRSLTPEPLLKATDSLQRGRILV